MKEKINRLSRGMIDLESPRITLSQESIRGQITEGTEQRGSLSCHVENGIPFKGLCYSSDPAVRLEKEIFGGLYGKIGYVISAKNLCAGEEICAELFLVTNAGERRIPLSFTVTAALKSGKRRTARKRGLRPGFSDSELVRVSHGPYPKFEGDLQGLVTMLLSEENFSRGTFPVYLEAVGKDLPERGLYEAVLLSMPEELTVHFPKNLYLYFLNERELREELALPLYVSVLKTLSSKDSLYQQYEKKMQQFAVEMLLQERIDRRLAVIYDAMLPLEILDERLSHKLSKLFHSYSLFIETESIRDDWEEKAPTALLLYYDHLTTVEKIPLQEGSASLSLLSDQFTISFLTKGGREEKLPYTLTKFLQNAQLRKKAERLERRHRVYQLRDAERALSGEGRGEDLTMLLSVIESLPLEESFLKEARHRVLVLLERKKGAEKKQALEKHRDFWTRLPLSSLSREDKEILLRLSMADGAYDRSREVLRECSFRDVAAETLRKLLPLLLRKKQKVSRKEETERMYQFCWKAVEGVKTLDSSCLPILLEMLKNYNSISARMEQLLLLAENCLQREDFLSEEVNREDMLEELREKSLLLAERLLPQLLFTGEKTLYHEVFRQYLRFGGEDELLIRAYLTELSGRCFLYKEKEDASFFSLLYERIRQEIRKERLPMLWLLCMSREMSEREELKGEERVELSEMMKPIFERNLLFPYQKRLRRFTELPSYLLDKVCIGYRSLQGEKPELFFRIEPGDQEFHAEEFPRQYQNIYVRNVLLFPGECLEYRISAGGKNISEGKASFEELSRERGEQKENSTLSLLISMSEERDCDRLLELSEQYLLREAIIFDLFAGKDHFSE